MIKRIKKTLTAVPASLVEAAQYMRSIGETQKKINKKKREAKEAKEKTDKEIASLKKDRDNFFVALFGFAQPRKTELTKEKRSVATDAGTFGWRWTTPFVEIREDKTDQDVISFLKREGMDKYVRIVEELDREALLRDRPTVKYVAYSQQDEFFAKPKLEKGEGRSEELVKITESIDV